MCLGIEKYNMNILGGTFMRNYDVVFDRKNKVIEFTRANCSKSNTFYDDYPDFYIKKESLG